MDEVQLQNLTIAEQERYLRLAQSLRLKRKIASPLPIVRVERSQPLPLSFAQQRLWFQVQMDADNDAYHIPLGFRLRGRLNKVAFKRALDRIVVRHEVLRTTFVMIEG